MNLVFFGKWAIKRWPSLDQPDTKEKRQLLDSICAADREKIRQYDRRLNEISLSFMFWMIAGLAAVTTAKAFLLVIA